MDKRKDLSALTNLLEIDPESTFSTAIEYTINQMPFIGKVYNTLKMRAFEKKINRLESRLHVLSNHLLERPDDLVSQFIKNRAFPFMLDQLLEEQQEEKTDLIMNGIEYIYEQRITEENKMLMHFDILKELRVNELKFLLRFTEEAKEVASKEDQHEEPSEDEWIYYEYIMTHLEALGLIDTDESSINVTKFNIVTILNDIAASKGKYTIRATRPRLTKFGHEFVKFFDLKSLIRLPAQ